MAELTITTFLSLDGVMQAPGGPEEDPSEGFPHGGWLVPHADEGMIAFMNGVFARASAFLLGRRTYEIFAAHWPRVGDDPIANPLNALPKHVASRTLEQVTWKHSSLVRDVVGEVAALKQRYPGELQVHGSAGLAQTLIEHDLIDEYRLLIFPVVVGQGKRLFGPGAMPRNLSLVSATTTAKGSVIATYRRGGGLVTGSFALPPE